MTDKAAPNRTHALQLAEDAAYGVHEGLTWMEALFCAIQRASEDDAKKLASIGQYLADRTICTSISEFDDLKSELLQRDEVKA